MKNVSYIIGNAGDIGLVVDGKDYTISVDHVNYHNIIDCLNNEDYDNLEKLMDVASAITLASEGEVTVLDGCVTFKGKEIVNPLTDRILRFVREGLPFKPMARFLENLMENPSRTSIQELYLFMEKNTLPITEDGCLLAYRKVDNDYMSFHNNPDGTKNRNMVGDVVEVERNEVDDIRDNVCSNGLHFCSMEYLPKYYGGTGRVVIVKINPKDVVSIPSDYDNAKGRCCRYEVVVEHTDPDKEYKPYSESAYTSYDGSEIDDEEETCPDCGEYLDDCACETCPDCGELIDDCECNICVDCGNYTEDCVCDEIHDKVNTDSTLGVKPDGSRFHNLRDRFGKFIKRS